MAPQDTDLETTPTAPETTPASAESVTPAAADPANTPADTSVDPVVVDPSAAVDVEAEAAADAAKAAETAAAAFVPNFKVKVMNKEHEIPEVLRSLITDEKSQKEVTDLVTRALGFDQSKRQYPEMQQKLQTTTAQLQQVSQRTAQIQAGYERLQSQVTSPNPDDFRAFVDFWKIPKEKFLQHAAELLRYDEMSPEERAQVDRQRSIAAQAETQGMQAQTFQKQALQAQAQLRQYQLDTALSAGSIDAVAKQFDTRAGQPGAFKARVIRTAQMHAITAQRDISVEQAIQETMAELGYDLVDDAAPGAPAGQPAPQAAPAQKIVASVQQKKLPVIPTGSASGASPVKKTFSSVADLVKERQRLAGQ